MDDRPPRRDVDPAVARLLAAVPPEIPDEPSLIRQPARALIAVGSVMAILSSPLPWAARTEIAGDVSKTGWQGTADGFLISVAAGVLCVIAFNRSAVEAKMQIIRRLPAILGAIALLLWLSGLRAMDGEIAIWRQEGYDGAYQPWLFVCLAGVIMLAAGGIWLGTRRYLSAGRPVPAVAVTKVAGSTVARGPGPRPGDDGRP
jgi:hypothetical protein